MGSPVEKSQKVLSFLLTKFHFGNSRLT
jgi:hypothetical protein